MARQCGLVPAEDKLVFVNAYSPEDGEPARIDWVCHDDSATHNLEATPSGHSPDQVIVTCS